MHPFAQHIKLPLRQRLLFERIDAIGWTCREWPRWLRNSRISTTLPPLRTIYLRKGAMGDPKVLIPLLAHELTHAERSIHYGRWRWTIRYGFGLAALYGTPVVALAGMLAWPWSSMTALALACVAVSWAVSGLVAWTWSERFRRAEEVEAEAYEAAAYCALMSLPPFERYAMGVISRGVMRAETLHGFRWPYFVRGDKETLYEEIAARASEILIEVIAEEKIGALQHQDEEHGG